MDYANDAQDVLGILESAQSRGDTAVITTVSACRETMNGIEAELTASQSGAVINEQTIRAFFYYSRLMRLLYDKGLLAHERDFDTDDRLAFALFSKITSADAPPLDENDGTFGPPPAEILKEITEIAFGNSR